MIEAEFKSKWEADKQIYKAWGEYLVSQISDELSSTGKDLEIFFKTPAVTRLKSDESLIDKAFYRKKNYDDPYEEIEDKVGARFVVLLLEDIDVICNVIENSDNWDFDPCKHFVDDKEKEPLLFTYQSVHYILRPKNTLQHGDISIPSHVACEVQIRTLLQHAHAELTHDAIYKSKKKIKPNVQRTVAKSMALIETTDEFFATVTKELNLGPLSEYNIIPRLDGLYKSFTGIYPHAQKSTLIIFDAYEEIISEGLIEDIQNKLVGDSNYSFLRDIIIERYADNSIYQQSVVLFLYWMLVYRKRRLLENWPTSSKIINLLANDVGVSLN